jgi:hypothetical protein
MRTPAGASLRGRLTRVATCSLAALRARRLRGAPIGVVYDYVKHEELRLGQPLTIMQTNLGMYANKF